MIKRNKTRQIDVGGVKIGGGAPVSVQSMTKVETSDVRAVVAEIKRLESCGCELVRMAVKTIADARAIRDIKKKVRIPVIADIHFDHSLALEAINSGADKIRINPGNMRKREDIAAVVKAAKRAKIPIRIGVNSGSIFTNDARRMTHDARVETFVSSALKHIKLFEGMGFRDIIISLKGSDVAETVAAYRHVASKCEYPMHLGVTASGPMQSGIVKSAIGIGALLLDGIGDTIRVSLTASPEEEVLAARRILSALKLRDFGPRILSCPTCGRCQVDLVKIANDVETALRTTNHERRTTKKPFTIALMGCEVNGPGEAKEADIGIAFGKDSGILFKNGKIIKKVTAKNAVKELLAVITSPAATKAGRSNL
jgi:(E)-4-hydroxy-3-methylbut-2-enyl-diphosphate synthase